MKRIGLVVTLIVALAGCASLRNALRGPDPLSVSEIVDMSRAGVPSSERSLRTYSPPCDSGGIAKSLVAKPSLDRSRFSETTAPRGLTSCIVQPTWPAALMIELPVARVCTG